MLEIGDLFRILSKLKVLQVLDLLLSKDELIFALLVGSRQFLLKVFHLLNEHFLVPQPLFKDHILLFLTFEVEFQQDFVLLLALLRQ
jgi:hypothetical protein